MARRRADLTVQKLADRLAVIEHEQLRRDQACGEAVGALREEVALLVEALALGRMHDAESTSTHILSDATVPATAGPSESGTAGTAVDSASASRPPRPGYLMRGSARSAPCLSAGGGLRLSSEQEPALYAETAGADAVVASSLSGHGLHAIGGGVRGGAGASLHPCGVFAEGGSGDGLYATGDETAVRGVSSTGYGASFAGGKAPLHLVPALTVGCPTAGEHQCGALVVDAEGSFWVCVAGGHPGTWRRVVVE
jgi:hypothetical protein